MSRFGRTGAAAFLAALVLASPAVASGEPEPFQLVRSLQLVQDRLASGDHAVLPLQRRVLAMTDRALRTADDTQLTDPRNFRAVLIYAMSGGNPATVEILLPRLIGIARAKEKAAADAAHAEEGEVSKEDGHGSGADEGHEEAGKASSHGEAQDDGHGGGKSDGHGEPAHGKAAAAKTAPPSRPREERLALGVYNYLRGRPEDARAALAATDPMAETPELGAYLALVRGSLEAANAPADAARLLDQAQLLGTGTLVEEAALRRAVTLAVQARDKNRFLRLSDSYARRFVLSPYASQWADSFVEGVVALRDEIELESLDRVTDGMDGERRRVLFLRIARRAGIEHATALADFASARAAAQEGQDDPRAKLYAALPKVATEESDAALADLRTIDPGTLTGSDRSLLQAAQSIAEGLTAPEVPGAPAAESEAAPADPAVEASEASLAGARKTLGDIDKLLGTVE